MESHPRFEAKKNPLALVLPALGVVFGDIGTSPLYALREAFHGPHAFEPTSGNVLGVLSLVLWTLLVVISAKYLLFVLRADNRGEGGVLALMALAVPRRRFRIFGVNVVLLYIGLFGATLLFGDGAITPAITVLGAVEGLTVVTPLFENLVIPISILILTILFLGQKFGTQRIGSVFGPIMLLWFIVLGALGLRGIMMDPIVLSAVNPMHAIYFFIEHGWHGLLVLGAVFLVATGGEALYADMGHFGKRPIQIAWFGICLPGLLLNYFGQGALILTSPDTIANPFYRLAPEWMLYPLLGLATLAAIIASQALISGVFSLARQAIQLGYLPRIRIVHTSASEIGQIYIPQINFILFIVTAWLLFEFKTSSSLASAYGIAVATTMVITTILAMVVARRNWHWNYGHIAVLTFSFLAVDLIFFSANISKITDGGWVPLVIGAVIFTIMTTWRRGRQILMQRLAEQSIPVSRFCAQIKQNPPLRVPGASVFMSGDPEGTPPGLLHNLRHNKILHETVAIVTIITEEVPHIGTAQRVEVKNLSDNIFRITGHYGFMETPNIHEILELARLNGVAMDPKSITFFLGRETILASERPGMAIWREKIFSFLSKNAERATSFFNIPPDQVVEIGIQIEM